MIWLLIALIAVIILLNRRPVSNCPGCLWAVDGQCGHPTASQVPEAAEIQMGAWRCPWREPASRGDVTALDSLNTCERCGRLPKIVSREIYRQDREEYAAACPRCGWRTGWHCSELEAVIAWNRRDSAEERAERADIPGAGGRAGQAIPGYRGQRVEGAGTGAAGISESASGGRWA